MKMKKIFTCLAMLFCTGYAMAADKLVVQDVYVPIGGEAMVTVNFQFDNSTLQKPMCAFKLDLPEKFSVVMDGDRPKGGVGTTVSHSTLEYDRGMMFSMPVASSTDDANYETNGPTATIGGTSGTLMTFYLSADKSFTKDDIDKSFDVTFSNIDVISINNNTVSDNILGDLTFKVHILPQMGDVDKSGAVDINDAVNILKYSWGVLPNGSIEDRVADIDKSGKFDINDAILALKISWGTYTSSSRQLKSYADETEKVTLSDPE
jgi:hypothetical protein